MKKTYFVPTAKTITLEVSELLANSIETGEDWNSGEGASNRRHVSIWDNDEE